MCCKYKAFHLKQILRVFVCFFFSCKMIVFLHLYKVVWDVFLKLCSFFEQNWSYLHLFKIRLVANPFCKLIFPNMHTCNRDLNFNKVV